MGEYARMSDKPIIFSAPMVLALLREGREAGTGKSQTRRLAWRDEIKGALVNIGCKPSPWQRVKPGDRLYVRETHYRFGRWCKDGKTQTGKQRWRFKPGQVTPGLLGAGGVVFEDEAKEFYFMPANKRADVGFHKRPSIFLPRWASRLTLIVTAAKIERLQAISHQDAIAEGIVEDDGSEPDIFYLPGSHLISGVNAPKGRLPIGQHDRPQLVFRDLINNLHGAEFWASNPEVVAVTFAVHQQNIDAMPKAA